MYVGVVEYGAVLNSIELIMILYVLIMIP